ncbi:5' nucleotidase, NT5C type [Microbulbifer sp. SSSA002]|uniref:5' nucleotidase, NT5C type n=1 Tax=Microbulbifer sp. SSSA002 TaxID=3243376 RepID=UPI00403A442E
MIVYIDMDDVLCDFSGASKRELERNPSIKFPQSQYGFFANLSPLIGAVNALLASEQYEPYILTAPSVKNPLCYTEKRVWVGNHLGMEMVNRLIISPNKSLLKGEFLIDDNITGRCQSEFEGELLHFGSNKYPDWNAVRAYFQV